jgi:formylglycine-generating enzyme required for sulfatase activity
LPTEAEWEYAAGGGAGDRTKWAGTNNENYLVDFAWYRDNSESRTHSVATKTPNTLGLYDMSGNIWEWCRDWYQDDYYLSSPVINPQGAAISSVRVSRGGSWGNSSYNCRVVGRSTDDPDVRYSGLGFRLALPLCSDAAPALQSEQ